MLKAQTGYSREVVRMQLNGNIVRNSVGGDECGLNGKNITTLVCRSAATSALFISNAANRKHGVCEC